MGSCPRDSGTPSGCSAIGAWFSGGRLGQRENDHRLPSGNPPGWIGQPFGLISRGLSISGLPRRDQADGVGAFLGGGLGAAFKVDRKSVVGGRGGESRW